MCIRDRLNAIQALEGQRALLGDAVVETALAPLRARLDALQRVSELAAPEQALRQVSILFLDIVGSTLLLSLIHISEPTRPY